MVIQCCVCKKVRVDGHWTRKVPEPLNEPVSHGYCPRCAEAAFAEIREIRETTPLKTIHSLSV